MNQHFFANGKYLGQRSIPTYTEILGEGKVAGSYILVCPDCSEVWGKVMHDCPGAFGNIVTSRCLKHANQPGDGLLGLPFDVEGHPRTLSLDWPDAALQYEFFVLCELTLRKAQREQETIPAPSTPHSAGQAVYQAARARHYDDAFGDEAAQAVSTQG